MSAGRELLELAAKAAGITPSDGGPVVVYDLQGVWLAEGGIHLNKWWNPLTDDGDALRLAVKLKKFPILLHEGTGVLTGYAKERGAWVPIIELFGDDPAAATRRAIVRAAAETAKAV